MKKLIVIFLIFVPLLSMAQEKDLTKDDGNIWRQWDLTARLFYVAGFISGTHSAVRGGEMPERLFMKDEQGYDESRATQILIDYWGHKNPKGPKKLFTREEVSQLLESRYRFSNSYLNKYTLYEITTGQIVDGLNKFYEDFRNRGIKVNQAIYVVKKQIKGASPEEVDAVCEYLRSDYNYDKLQYKSKDGTIKYAEFP